MTWWEDAERAASYDPQHDDPDVDDQPDLAELLAESAALNRRARDDAAAARRALEAAP